MRPVPGADDDDHDRAGDRPSWRPKASERRVTPDRERPAAPIDAACQRLRPLVEYADRLPSGRRGKRLNRATLWRWALRGLRGGRRLRTVTAGGTRVTCDAWVWEFIVTLDTARSVPRRQRVDGVEREQIGRRLRVGTDPRSGPALAPRRCCACARGQ